MGLGLGLLFMSQFRLSPEPIQKGGYLWVHGIENISISSVSENSYQLDKSDVIGLKTHQQIKDRRA